jgi:(1->4)-alpha-D-glucan 1-alpha-D-glucosylmutase
MLLQTIVGAWPLDLDRQDKAGRAAFAARLEGWQRKALREAKLESDWAAVNEPYEEASQRFLRALLVDAEKPELLDEIAGFVEAIAAAGAVNGLAQLLLKLTVPGVPDIYQGTEYWDFSLVDPDNRRPVDYGTRATTLGGAPVGALATCWRDGRIKQAILACALDLRRRNEEVFSAGSYEPVLAEGPMADRVVAFMRRRGGRMLLTVVPRLPADLMGDPDTIALDARSWKNTVLRLEPPPQGLIDVFSGDAVNVPAAGLPLAAVCGAVPIGLVCSASMISSDVPVAGNATS